MMANNGICVVLSTYNGERYLTEQLESIENQTVVPDCIYIRDDGSTDGTRNIIMKLAKKYDNISYDFGQNVGWRVSFIKALESCPEYSWYSFCDQDDVWLPGKLQAALTSLRNSFGESGQARPLLYAGNVSITDAELNVMALFNKYPVDIVNKDFPHTLTMDEMAGGLTYVFNSSAKDMLIGFRERGITGHDRLLMLICKLYGSVVYDYNSYVLYRQHGNNVMGAIARPAPRKSLIARLKALSVSNERERQKIARGLLNLSDSGFSADPEAVQYLELVARCGRDIGAKARLFFSRNVGAYRWQDEIKFRVRILCGGY